MPRETGAFWGTGLSPAGGLFVVDLGQSVFSIGAVTGTDGVPGMEAVAIVGSTLSGAFFAVDCVFVTPLRCAVTPLGCAVTPLDCAVVLLDCAVVPLGCAT